MTNQPIEESLALIALYLDEGEVGGMFETWQDCVLLLDAPSTPVEVSDVVVNASRSNLRVAHLQDVLVVKDDLSIEVQLQLLEAGAWNVLRRSDLAVETIDAALGRARLAPAARWEVVCRLPIPEDLQAEWMASSDVDLRWAFAGNASLTPSLQEHLFHLGEDDVLERLCGNGALTTGVMRLFAGSAFRELLTYRSDLPEDVQLQLLRTVPAHLVAPLASSRVVFDAVRAHPQWNDPGVPPVLGSSPRLPDEVLWEMVASRGVFVAGLASNPRTTREMFLSLVKDPSAAEEVALGSFASRDVLYEIIRHRMSPGGAAYENAVEAAFWNPCFQVQAWMPAGDVWRYASPFCFDFFDAQHVDEEAWRPLIDGWTGSLSDLAEACHLTER